MALTAAAEGHALRGPFDFAARQLQPGIDSVQLSFYDFREDLAYFADRILRL